MGPLLSLHTSTPKNLAVHHREGPTLTQIQKFTLIKRSNSTVPLSLSSLNVTNKALSLSLLTVCIGF